MINLEFINEFFNYSGLVFLKTITKNLSIKIIQTLFQLLKSAFFLPIIIIQFIFSIYNLKIKNLLE